MATILAMEWKDWPPFWPPWILEWKDLSNLILQLAPLPPTKFQLNPTCDSGGDIENVKC